MGKCPIYKKCNGCQLMNMEDYNEQLKWKQKQVARLFEGVCGVRHIVGAEDPFHYRNKAQPVFRMTRDGKTVSGIYQSANNGVAAIDSCLLENKRANEITVEVRKLMKSFKLLPADGKGSKGFLRSLLIRTGAKSGEIMVVFVTEGPIFPSKNNFVKALIKQCPDITTVIHSINSSENFLTVGNRQTVLYGSGKIKDTLCGCTFSISPSSFYQINPAQTERLYNIAMEFAHLTGEERVIDAYCGTGTIGIIASKKAGVVIGVESNKAAVNDARENAKLNKCRNMSFACEDAGKFMRDLAENDMSADVVFADPPRNGCSQEFLDSVAILKPQKLVYISCNPETQVRDIKYLMQKGYKPTIVQPVDMFPHTKHVESVCLMSRVDK
ncbi:MAG: 23S rRNA (uracil(1939)-C(5))-methyltransferase RlmD [Eubacteriales bacterium]|nr:23S rRNA (uracil(1939)-C(5))-methyltransferase RlmD [Eubacteriales bacterium]